MRIISFDVGIKNMAYCIFDCSSTGLSVLDWNVLNLMDVTTTVKHQCNCMLISKSKKILPKPCNKSAKYFKNENYYCEKHAVKCSHIIPTKIHTPAALNKMKYDDLLKFANSYHLLTNVENQSKILKKTIMDLIQAYLKEHCLEKIIPVKTKTASETDLIKIGKNMKGLLNNVTGINEVTHVLIENQISPIANRMKTIQGMLAQYFIMNNTDIVIEFVSSANKLKQFSKPILENKMVLNDTSQVIVSGNVQSANYKEHKKDGVFYCSRMIDENPIFHPLKDMLNTKKKDDLADSFLQGIWYLKHNNIILCADDLKINIV